MNPLQGLTDLLGRIFKPTTYKYDYRQPSNGLTQLAKLPQPTHNPGYQANTVQSAQPTAQPSIAPQIAPQGDFKYQMGQQDYSKLKPQIDAILKGSPLEKYSNDFISAANTHGVDPRVLVTIANNESSLGRNYPTDSNNPFGYLVNPTTGHGVQDVYTGLRNAGFTSLPMAIDRLTGRFQRQPTEGYKTFYQDPTISNLQQAYNANPSERQRYLDNAQDLVRRMGQ